MSQASPRDYYTLAKPGIVYGNLLPAVAGFLLAARGTVNYGLLLASMLGLALVMASGCIFNNYLDRPLDARMQRTKQRPSVSNRIPLNTGITYGLALLAAGSWLLGRYANLLSLALALLAFFLYVVAYGVAKRRSVHGTLVGSIPGALPPVIGYCAVSGQLDLGALLLFLILVAWQMPHFYAIAIYRLQDYQAAGLPVLPAVRGVTVAKMQILAYVVLFLAVSVLPTLFHLTGYAYLAVMVLLGAAWLHQGLAGWQSGNDQAWARGMFRFSLIALTLFSLMLAVDVVA